MAWNSEGTQQKILDAAVELFAAHGPDGTTIERIAAKAGVNKERIYNYFGGKQKLFAHVLRKELAAVAQDVPITSYTVDGIGDYAGRVYDYHRKYPRLTRLLRWEGLLFATEVPDESLRREYYRYKAEAISQGQQERALDSSIDADHLT